MVNYKEYFKLSFLYTVVAAFPNVLQLIVYPIIEGKNKLTAFDFGHLAITEAITTFAFIVILFSMGSGISRFYYDYKHSKEGYNKLVSTTYNGILVRGALLLGLCLIISPFVGNLFSDIALQDFGRYGFALVITGINRSIITAAVSLYRNEKRVSSFILVNVASGIFRSLFQVGGIFLFEMSFVGYVYGTAVGGSMVSLAILAYSWHKHGLHFTKSIRTEIYKFASPLFQYELISWGLGFADRFFLMDSPLKLGIYDNAMKFALGIQLVIQGLTSATQPEIFELMHKGLKENMQSIKSLSNMFIMQAIAIIALAIIPVMIFISVFYETDLRLSATLISIVFIRYILRAQYQVFSIPLLFNKKTKVFSIINTAILVLNIGLNWLLIPILSIYGAIVALLFSFSVQVIAIHFVQQRYIPIAWNYKKVLVYPLSIILFSALVETLKVWFNINPYLAAALIVAYIFVGMWLLYKTELIKIINKRFNPAKR